MTADFDSLESLRPLMDKCVHCGFCLSTCPSYLLLGQEMDSPRGRIYLMRAGGEGRVAMSDVFVRHFDSCLGCMACETACPSGVRYAPLIEQTRAAIEDHHRRPLRDRFFRAMLFSLLPYPFRLRLLGFPLAIARRLSRSPKLMAMLPPKLRTLFVLAPTATVGAMMRDVPERTTPPGPPRMKVGLVTGCVQRAFFGHVNEATVRVLAADGCEVIAPPNQGCCGALAVHAGRDDDAREFARKLIAVFERAGVEQVVVNAAGCGSAMKEYGHLLKNDPQWAERARRFAEKVRDVTETLAELASTAPPGERPASDQSHAADSASKEPRGRTRTGAPSHRARRHAMPLRIAYHDACHLAHAQGVRRPPRAVLEEIPDLTVVPLAESEICCGSAGIFNLVEPDMAARLGERKVDNIALSGADAVVTSNPGCLLQITAAARAAGKSFPIFHILELLDASMQGVDPHEWLRSRAHSR